MGFLQELLIPGLIVPILTMNVCADFLKRQKGVKIRHA